jgi:hypothetical protein
VVNRKIRPFRRSRCKLEDNIEMVLEEICYESVGWIDQVQDTDKWSEGGYGTLGDIKCGQFIDEQRNRAIQEGTCPCI